MAYVNDLTRSRSANNLILAGAVYVYQETEERRNGQARAYSAAAFAAICNERQCASFSQAIRASCDAYFGPVWL